MTKTFAATLLAGTSALALLAPGGASAAQDGFADLVAKVSPAVVNIATTHHIAADQGAPAPEMPFHFPPGSPFEQFFKHYFDRGMGDQGQGGVPREARALGSGFIIDAEGHVVTNNHVIDGADAITVTLEDGTELDATLVGTDPSTDLALLKVDASKPLPFVTWGESDDVRVGDWVLAVGNPFGLGGTVTAGILSARGRDIGNGPLDDYLQIDAPINQGNSGGPTFDEDGRVIGVNSAIFSPSGGSVGIGFAVPSDLAKDVVADLMEDGKVERGWFGVQIQEVSPDIAEGLGMSEPHGALVASVMPDSPAAASGVQAGDVVVRYDGKEIAKMRDLPRLVATTPAGTEVEIVVLRDGRERTLDTTIVARTPPTEVASADAEARPADTATLGLALAPVDDRARQRFGLREDARGVLVVDVDPSGPAAGIGLRPGDLIVQVAQDRVATPDDVRQAVDAAIEAKRSTVLLLVERDGNALFVAVPVEKA